MAKATTSPTPTPLRGWKARGGDRKSTRLNSSHTVIYTLSLHDALPISRGYNAGQVIRVPTAHGEGNYVADADTIARLEGEGRVIFRYVAPDGVRDPAWNVNGSTNAIAGIVNERGNVLGM